MWDITLDDKLSEIIPKDRILRDEAMSEHTTFRTGGKAARFISVRDTKELTDLLELLGNLRIVYSDKGTGGDDTPSYYVIGNGSNLLVSDSGYDGLVIELGSRMICNPGVQYKISDDHMEACAGMLLGKLAAAACEAGLSGLEFAAGIPGSVGGAVVMNAGAYGGQMQDIVSTVTVYDEKEHKIVRLDSEAMEFSYRHSVIKDMPYIVMEAGFELKKGIREEIESRIKELNAKRREKQPLEYPSAGSTFKRPEGFYAGALIEESGLKGYAVGGAAVSDKHAGFVINRDRATSSDIYRLICEVREKVYAETGVRLEPEVIFLGRFQ